MPTRKDSPTRLATRRRIVDAAIKVVGGKGLHEASVRTIAREAGCNEAVIYHHFENKSRMKEEIFAEVALELAESRRLATHAETDPRSFIRTWIEESYRFYDERPNAFAYTLLSFPSIIGVASAAYHANSQLFRESIDRLPPPDGRRWDLSPVSFSAFRASLIGPPRDIHAGVLDGPAIQYVEPIASVAEGILLPKA
jgi:AcrR family transcriptional regulator